jgi:dolichol-phosphate mannosyltransferase
MDGVMAEPTSPAATGRDDAAQRVATAEPTLPQTLSHIWTRLRGAGIASGTGIGPPWPGIGADLVATLSLLVSGWSLAAASLAGFALGVVVDLGVRGWTNKPALRVPPPRERMPVIAERTIVVTALALGVRGGAIGTVLAMGFPLWMAVVAGIAAGALVLNVGHAHYVQVRDGGAVADISNWAWAAVGIIACVLCLRVLYMQPMPVMPQEAYYWNYSIHPALGYHDHPPMVAWLIAAGEAVSGHGPVGVRLGASVCGLGVIAFIYLLAARLVGRGAALVAAALGAVLPYFFLASGGMMTPDAPLTLAWAAALYFFHRALVGGERVAWLGVGAAMGLGMLSKYTIALLGPSALAFCLLDKQARRWLLRPEPWLAMALALILFLPVIYWNYLHDWASFRFQGEDRFGSESRFALHRLLATILAAVTPLPLLVLPLLGSPRWTDAADAAWEPAHADARNRRFVSCFVAVPLAVFAWSSLRHLPRLNWNGPIWLAVLPLLAWAIVRAPALRMRMLGSTLRACTPHVLAGLLVLYPLASYYLAFGFPAIGYPRQAAPLLGWSSVARELSPLSAEIRENTGAAPVVVGMDAYQIASELSFYGRPPYVAPGGAVASHAAAIKPLDVTAIGELFGGDGLMFSYWNPPAQLAGRTLLMVTGDRAALQKASLPAHFSRMDPDIHALPLAQVGVGGERQVIDQVYYRIGYGYQPHLGEP